MATSLKIRPPLPNATSVKRPLVLIAAAIILFLLIFAFVKAFETNKTTDLKQPKIELKHDAAINEKEINPILQNIPQNYNDTEGIKRYLSLSASGENEVKNLQIELQELKADNFILHRQIEAAKARSSGTTPRLNNQNNRQAISSGLFFSGLGQQAMSLLGSKDNPQVQNPVGNQNNSAMQTEEDLLMQKLPLPVQKKIFSKQIKEKQRLAVLKAADNVEDIYDLHNITTPVSPYEVQAGSIIPAVLITAINTSVAGTVVAQVRFNIYDTVKGKYLLIPKGSRIIGEYDAKISYGQRRVLIAFTRIIRPDGSAILVGKPTAADVQGEAGVEGNIDNHWGKVLGAATLSTILSVGAGVISDNSSDKHSEYPSSRQNAILGASRGISQAGDKIVSRALDVSPTITIPSGFQFNIIVRRDMVLEPYKNWL